jgi:acyl-CoA thioesterase-1
MRAKAIGVALAPLLFMSGMAAAQDQRCEAPDAYIEPYYKATRAALSLRSNKSLDILIVSSAPSQTRMGDKLRSYPMFLETALKERLPNYEIRVAVHTEARKSIKDILAALPRALEKNKPALVILQTGTVEAIAGVDPDKYERKLESAIEVISRAGADTILVNPQFSPRTSFLTNSGALNDRIRRVASYSDVSLFSRYDIMRHWSENEAFDFTALKADGTYEAVHRCLGRILAEFVSRAASFAEIAKLPK